jgi:hypothetical protein
VFADEYDVSSAFRAAGEIFAVSPTMSKARKLEAAQASNAFQFTLAGLIVFSLALMGGASFITYKLAVSGRPKLAEAFAVDSKDKSSTVRTGPWGELLLRDISLQRPAEYLTEEVANPKPEVWMFSGINAAAAKALLVKNGLTAGQADAAFAPGSFNEDNSGTELLPSAEFLLSLNAEARRKLFVALSGLGVNLYLDYPYIFPSDTIESIYTDPRLHPDDVALLKRLVYPNGDAQQLSDYPMLLCQIPTEDRRVALASALSRQSAVLARLVIRPDTDIDKVAAYWGNVPGVRFTDTRPLLESLKQLPEGGSVSLLYLLPKFARDRLYTFPLPPQPGEPTMDCHWTTFNFGSDTPDNRFNDPAYAIQYIQKNFYQIAGPSLFGDIVLLMNDRQQVKHSAVYLADDIVFTKNGNNYRQPWMLMRIPDLLATYPSTPPMKVVYMRHRTD